MIQFNNKPPKKLIVKGLKSRSDSGILNVSDYFGLLPFRQTKNSR